MIVNRRKILNVIILLGLIIGISNVFQKNVHINTIYLFLIDVTISFTIIAILIIRESKQLELFHIDKFSILTLIFFCFFRTKYNVNGEIWFTIIFIIIGLTVGIFTIKNWRSIPNTNFRFIFLGLIIGVVNAIFAIVLLNNTGNVMQKIDGYKGLSTIIIVFREFISTLSSAVIYEEIIFRGFLWGYLRQVGYSDGLSCIFQGVIFWLIHFSKYGFSIPELIIIFLLTISTTIIVRYSRQVFPALVIHSFTNALTNILLYIVTWR